MEATPAIVDIDLTTPGNTGSETYRIASCGTQVASDFLRQKFITAGVSDYNVDTGGIWPWRLNYTRTFPTNNYYIYGRLASAAGAYGATSSRLTGGVVLPARQPSFWELSAAQTADGRPAKWGSCRCQLAKIAGGSVGRSANSANDQRLHQRLKRELLYVRPRARANDTGCLFD